jgi:hypothetical protein
MMPQYVSASPNAFICVKSGTISAWNGTISPARTIHWRASRPRKRIRENANAAMLAVRIVPAVITDAVTRLLKYHCRMLPCSSAARYASSVAPVLRQLTGAMVVSASGFSDVATAQATGTSQISARTTSAT